MTTWPCPALPPGSFGPAAAGVVLDLHQEASPILLAAQSSAAVDAATLRELVPGARERGGVRWMLPLGRVLDAPGTDETLRASDQLGRMWVVTGEVPRWWQAYRERPGPPLEVPVAELFGGGSWAAVMPLLAQPDEHGVGTRPTRLAQPDEHGVGTRPTRSVP